MIKPWKTISTKAAGNFRIFKIREDKKVSPLTGEEHDFVVIDSPGWVNIIAVTPDDQLVMVEQFRHGTNTVELEIPGGMMDAGETDPVATGVRELQEETGYSGDKARILSRVWANPAIMSNTCYTVIVENCQLRHKLKFDAAEDLVTRLVPVAEIPKLVTEEKILHPLVVAALYRFDLYRRAKA